MRTFKQYYENLVETKDVKPQIKPLMEGGNVVVNGKSAGPVEIGKMSDEELDHLKRIVGDALTQINKGYGNQIWEPTALQRIIKDGTVFAGSTRTLFAKDAASYKKVKPVLGDIDTLAPAEGIKVVKEDLHKLQEVKVGEAICHGFEHVGTGASTRLELPKEFKPYGDNIQIDLLAAEFDEKGFPTKFAKFGAYSSWQDMEQGLKGVASKMLLAAVAKMFLEQVPGVVVKKSAKGEWKPVGDWAKGKRDVSPMSFSTFQGARLRFRPVKGLTIDGVQAYEEIPTSESKYETGMDKLFIMFFKKVLKRKPTAQEVESMHSFVRFGEFLNKNVPKQTLKELREKFNEQVSRTVPQMAEKLEKAFDNFVLKSNK